MKSELMTTPSAIGGVSGASPTSRKSDEPDQEQGGEHPLDERDLAAGHFGASGVTGAAAGPRPVRD